MATPEQEMIAEFEENCALQRDASAEHVLHELYELNIGELLQQGQIQWAGKEKKFALGCMAGLGRQVFKLLNGEGRVSGSHIMDAVDLEISCWERTCPLPTLASATITLDKSCRTVQEMRSARTQILNGETIRRERPN